MKTPTSTTQGSAPQRGFTLVEMLITITIILILAALMLAGLTRMRNSAYQTTSMRNIAQLQAANASYASDHNGKYVPWTSSDADGNGIPGATYWMNNWEFLRCFRGEPIVGQEGRTPLAMLDPITVRAKKRMYDCLDSSYGYNTINMPDAAKPGDGWLGRNAHPSFSVQQVTHPGQTAAFITATDMRASDAAKWWADRANQVEGRTEDGKIAYRHGGKALVVYYDGHVSALTKANMDQINSGTTDKTKIPFWNAGWQPTP